MSEEELISIKGGLAKSYFYGILVTTITFLIGLFDGIVRPVSCNG